jgi:hypothetical protein
LENLLFFFTELEYIDPSSVLHVKIPLKGRVTENVTDTETETVTDTETEPLTDAETDTVAATSPPPVWEDYVPDLPADRSYKGGSLPSAALLHALVSVDKANCQKTIVNTTQLAAQLVSKSTYASELDEQETHKIIMYNDNTKDVPNRDDNNTSSLGLDRVDSPDYGLEDPRIHQEPDFIKLPGPTYANMGDYLVFICESVRSQSEMIINLEKTEKKQARMLLTQSEMILMLQLKLDGLATKLDFQFSGGELSTAVTVHTPESPTPADSDLSSAVHPLNRVVTSPRHAVTVLSPTVTAPSHAEDVPSPKHRDSVIRALTNADQNESFKCNDCSHQATSYKQLDYHIESEHTRPNNVHRLNNKYKKTRKLHLFMGDSNMKGVNMRLLERATGGLLFSPGSSRPREARVYCSTRDWRGARFPSNNMTDIVPEQLRKRTYSSLILQAPCNDISNLRDLQTNTDMIYTLAEESSYNTIAVIEKALKENPSLEQVTVLERLPRDDSLSDVSEYSNFVLRQLAEQHSMADRIVVGSHMELLGNAFTQVMGSPSSTSYDGVHLEGPKGRQYYLDMIVQAVQQGWERVKFSQSESQKNQCKSPIISGDGVLEVSNRFTPLNN